MTWRSALEKVVALAAPALEQEETRWALIGSVALALQGCQIVPRDIDILALTPAGVYRFAEAMAPYTPPNCEYPLGHGRWRSSEALPVSTGPDEVGFYWHFGRWDVEGQQVEIAHIVAPEGSETSEEGAGIWEAGPEIWSHIRQVPFAGGRVPVVPLEIQLETNLQRGMEERVAEVVGVLRRDGYDAALLDRSLSTAHRAAFRSMIEMTGRSGQAQRGSRGPRSRSAKGKCERRQAGLPVV